MIMMIALTVSSATAFVVPGSCGDLTSIDDCVAYGECDANQDGYITFGDVVRIREYIAALESECGYTSEDCDVVGDGNVNILDALCLSMVLQPVCHPVSVLDDCAAYGMCDSNGDGVIDYGDIDYIAEFIVGNVETCGYTGTECFCDVNGDGVVDILDIDRLIDLLGGQGDVPEFGLIAGAVALLGAAGFVLYRRK